MLAVPPLLSCGLDCSFGVRPISRKHSSGLTRKTTFGWCRAPQGKRVWQFATTLSIREQQLPGFVESCLCLRFLVGPRPTAALLGTHSIAHQWTLHPFPDCTSYSRVGTAASKLTTVRALSESGNPRHNVATENVNGDSFSVTRYIVGHSSCRAALWSPSG